MTITEIARLAGVSIGTVDRVLHDRGRVSSETEAKVRAIAKKYGYQPDPLARHLKKHKQYKIGVLFPSLKSGSGYWNKVFEGAENYIKQELAAFSFSLHPFFFDRYDNDALSSAFGSLLESDCSAYVIAPVMQEKMCELLLQAENLKPYCLVDTSIHAFEISDVKKNKPLSVITQNPYRAGFIAGKLTELLGGKSGTYAVIEIYGGAYNQNERARGFCAWFEEKKRCNVEHIILENSSSDKKDEIIRKALDSLFESHEDVSGICTVSVEDQMVAKYIADKNISGVAVTGFDLIDENARLLREEKISCLIDQEPEEQGKIAMYQIYRHLIFEETPKSKIDIPIDIFFKENLPIQS